MLYREGKPLLIAWKKKTNKKQGNEEACGGLLSVLSTTSYASP